MMKMFKHAGIAVLGLSAALLSGSALAVPTTLAGTNVSFTFDSALLGLYGTPIVAGDSLVFTPTGFSAISNNGAGFVMTNATLNVAITANAGYQFSTINLTERGDYFLLGSDAYVGVSGQIRVFDQDDPINNEVTGSIIPTAPFNVVSTPPIVTTNWTANASATIPGSGWGGSDGIVDGINLTIENLLYASTTLPGSAAFIEKKFAATTIIISAVPEADTYAMMLAGLGLIGFMARRRATRMSA
jgi:hypothetical protein